MTQSAPPPPPGPGRRAAQSSRWFVGRRGSRALRPGVEPVAAASSAPATPDAPATPAAPSRRGGERVLRTRRRAHGLPGTIGLTALTALVPGAGYLYAGRRVLGGLVLAAWVAVLGGLAWYFSRDVGHALDLAFNTTQVRLAVAALGLGLLTWVVVVVTSYLLVRPRTRPRAHTWLGYATVLVLVAALGAPVVVGARYALVTADLVDSVFAQHVDSATAPTGVTATDPWGGRKRVNILLLGGDGGVGRTGIRTDSIILASMDTQTGKTITFSLPRNMLYAHFPKDSPLHDVYPDGYGKGGSLDPSFYELNAIYGQVPLNYPHILGKSDNEGADAIKEAVAGSLGLQVDYYMLINLAGFQQVVDAMGGITVNVNEPVAINGNTDAQIPPTGYIEPGPEQHLDGFHALWFARGRYGADDYQRMDRQRCAVQALVDAADPTTLLSHYVALAKAGEKVVATDIPRSLGSAFVELLLKVKDSKIKSVVFQRSDKFYSEDPNFKYIHHVVNKALHPPVNKHGKPHHEAEVQKPDVCGYHPLDGTSTSDGTSTASP